LYLVFTNVHVRMFTFAICHRPSVCVVCNVRAPTPHSGDWNFWQGFYAIWYVGHLLTSR